MMKSLQSHHVNVYQLGFTKIYSLLTTIERKIFAFKEIYCLSITYDVREMFKHRVKFNHLFKIKLLI